MMSFALFFMATQKHHYVRLREELDKAFPDPLGPLGVDELAQLPFLDAVIHETLRFGSPYFIPRLVPKGGVRVDDHFIPEDTVVAAAAYSQQMDSANFSPDPLVRPRLEMLYFISRSFIGIPTGALAVRWTGS